MIPNQKKDNEMATKQITIERFSVISAKTFAEVASAIAAQVGHPDIKQFYEAIQAAEDDQELQRVVNLSIFIQERQRPIRGRVPGMRRNQIKSEL